MKILIIGASGFIGHKLLQVLSKDFEIYGLLHRSKKYYGDIPLFNDKKIKEEIDVLNYNRLVEVFDSIQPDIIINCVGITKRKITTNNILETITINSQLPHRLAKWTKENNKKLIHLSTDCVFDGKIGNYNEESLTTAEDMYGRTKALGEVKSSNTLVIRASFIGLELFSKTELLEWFLSKENKTIKGFTNTMYSGVSTIYLSKIVKEIIINHQNLFGLYQLAPIDSISKYDLLFLAKKYFKVNIKIIPDDKQIHKPTLDASKLTKRIGLKVPSWDSMMNQLAKEKDLY
jgi:dTDP-4-dehydrorhamnose reductase